LHLVGVNSYSAVEADKSTMASAMIKAITIRMAGTLPFPFCAVPTLRLVEGSRAGAGYDKVRFFAS
jgi:hypothetical protein